jgi:hypothetical protein
METPVMTHDDKTSAKVANTSEDRSTLKTRDASQIKRELTDDEIAAVAGGLNPQPLPPSDPHPEV